MKTISQAIKEIIEEAYKAGMASGVMACVPDELVEAEEINDWLLDNAPDQMCEDLWLEDKDWLEGLVKEVL